MQRTLPESSVVIVVDVQEKLVGVMPEQQIAELVRATTVLLEAAKLLGARAIATEQYPEGLGPTIARVAEALDSAGAPRVAKKHFAATDEPVFERAFAKARARTAIVVGMEAHVCVFQTARDLAARGLEVLVPIDGVASRRDDHRAAGLDLCRAAGATLTTMETVVFDWLRLAHGDAFKRLSKLIR